MHYVVAGFALFWQSSQKYFPYRAVLIWTWQVNKISRTRHWWCQEWHMVWVLMLFTRPGSMQVHVWGSMVGENFASRVGYASDCTTNFSFSQETSCSIWTLWRIFAFKSFTVLRWFSVLDSRNIAACSFIGKIIEDSQKRLCSALVKSMAYAVCARTGSWWCYRRWSGTYRVWRRTTSWSRLYTDFRSCLPRTSTLCDDTRRPSSRSALQVYTILLI